MHSVLKDPNGCFLIMDIEILKKRVTLINVYGPSSGDHPEFYENILQLTLQMGNDINIFSGDWNCILNLNLDAKNYNTTSRPNTRAKIFNLIGELDLADAYRELYPDKRSYTWKRFNSNKQGRLDYFFISTELLGEVRDITISPGYRTDHSLVTLTLRKEEFKRDRPFWKMNNTHLRDENYLNEIKKVIREIKLRYAVPVYNMEKIDEVDLEDIQFTISDQLFFETLLIEIRGKTISYSSYIKKQTNIEEKILLEELEELGKIDDPSDENLRQIDTVKDNLLNIRNKRMEGVAIRTKTKWIDKGEKATRYFCNL